MTENVVIEISDPGRSVGFLIHLSDFANVLKPFIGSNFLSIPFGLKQCGLGLGIGSLLLIGILTAHCCHLLIKCRYYAISHICNLYRAHDDTKFRYTKNSPADRLLPQDMEDSTRYENRLIFDHLVSNEVTERKVTKTEEELHKLRKKLLTTIRYGDMARMCFGNVGFAVVNAAILLTQVGFTVNYAIFTASTIYGFFPVYNCTAVQMNNETVSLSPDCQYLDHAPWKPSPVAFRDHGDIANSSVFPEALHVDTTAHPSNDKYPTITSSRISSTNYISDRYETTVTSGVWQTNAASTESAPEEVTTPTIFHVSVEQTTASYSVLDKETSSLFEQQTTITAGEATSPNISDEQTTARLVSYAQTRSNSEEQNTTQPVLPSTQEQMAVSTEQRASATVVSTEQTTFTSSTVFQEQTTPALSVSAEQTTLAPVVYEQTTHARLVFSERTTSSVVVSSEQTISPRLSPQEQTTSYPLVSSAQTTSLLLSPDQPSSPSAATKERTTSVNLQDQTSSSQNPHSIEAAPSPIYLEFAAALSEEQSSSNNTVWTRVWSDAPDLHLFFLAPTAIFLVLVLPRSIRALGIISATGNVGIIGGALLVLLALAAQFHLSDSWQWSRLEGLPVFFGTVASAFEGAGTILPVEAAMDGNHHNFPCLLYICVGLVLLIFEGVCVLSYLTFGDSIQQIITMNITAGSGLSIAVNICLMIGIICTFPLMAFPVVNMADRALFGPDGLCRPKPDGSSERTPLLAEIDEMDDKYLNKLNPKRARKNKPWKRNVIGIVVVLIIGGLGILMRDSFAYISAFIGALGSTMIAYILPCLFHLRLCWPQLPLIVKLKDMAIIVAGCIFTVTGVYSVVTSLV